MKMGATQTAVVVGAGFLVLMTGLTVAATRSFSHHDTPTPSWQSFVRQVDERLAVNDLSGAERAWHNAYTAALGSRGWEGMIAVGDASLRIGTASLVSGPALTMARQSYLTALVRARATGSIDGILRTAGAFDALGDRDVSAQLVRVATALAARSKDPEARVRVDAFATRLDGRAVNAELF